MHETRAGRATHEGIAADIRALVSQRGAAPRGDALRVELEPLLRSSKLPIEGCPDVVVHAEDAVTILDFKSAARPPALAGSFGPGVWDNHAAQVTAYGVAGREVYRRPLRLFVVYSASGVRTMIHRLISDHPEDSAGRTLLRIAQHHGAEVPLDDRNVSRLAKIVERIERLSAVDGFARSHQSVEKCFACVHRAICPSKLQGVPAKEFPTGPENPGLRGNERSHYPKANGRKRDAPAYNPRSEASTEWWHARDRRRWTGEDGG